jgi:uncharacterized protein YjbJ (UPF0337 family)
MEGVWKQRRGKAVYHWGRMMNDELAAIAGKYEELVGKLQARFGIASEESERQMVWHVESIKLLSPRFDEADVISLASSVSLPQSSSSTWTSYRLTPEETDRNVRTRLHLVSPDITSTGSSS